MIRKTREQKRMGRPKKKAAAKSFRLVPVITTSQTIGIREIVKINGMERSKYRWIRIQPGKLYDFLSDEAMKDILGHTTKVPFRPEFEQALKDEGIEYEKIFCPSCGGKIKTLSFKTCEVVEDA